MCDEKPISILEKGTRISFFQSHVRDEKENFFLSISCFETRTRISFFQSWTSRRERESRLRQFSREFLGIIFIACLLTDIFKKRLLISQNFLKLNVFFSREICMKISFFETRTGIPFYQSHVSRRERECSFCQSCETRTRNTNFGSFSQEFKKLLHSNKFLSEIEY